MRALTPHVGAYLETRRRRAARRAPRARRRRRRQDRRGARPSGGRCCSAAAAGALRLEVVQPPGGKPMPADAYLRGHPLPELREPRDRAGPRARLRDDPGDLRGRRLHRARLPRERRAGSAWTAASAPRRSASPTAPCSAAAPPTPRSSASPTARPGLLDPPVLAALRLGLYELLFADGDPRPRRRRPGGRAGQGRRRRPRLRPRQRGPAPRRPRARSS